MTQPTPSAGIPVEGFGRYEVLGLVGRGSFADVVRAWDEALASYVAIKVLSAEASKDPFVRARFVEEGQLLRRVRSPAVIGVHDVGELSDVGRISWSTLPTQARWPTDCSWDNRHRAIENRRARSSAPSRLGSLLCTTRGSSIETSSQRTCYFIQRRGLASGPLPEKR